jgi:hypothetical protein
VLSSNSALAVIRYFCKKEIITEQSGAFKEYKYTEEIILDRAVTQARISRKPSYPVPSHDGNKFRDGAIYTLIDSTATYVFTPAPALTYATIPTLITTLNPIATSSSAPIILGNRLAVLSELNKVNLTSLTEDKTVEQIEDINNAVDELYESTLGNISIPEEAITISRLAKENDIDLNKYYNPNNTDSSEDVYVNTLSSKEQGQLYLAAIYDVENHDTVGGNNSERIVKEQTLDQKVNRLEIYDELVQIATDTTNSRIMELVASDVYRPTPIITSSTSSKIKNYTGLSAGDQQHNLNAVWIRGTYGHVKQGKNLKNSSFYGNVYGSTIGADGNLTDDTLIGISYTRLYANFKYKSGLDKSRTISDIMSVYGISKLNDKYTLQGLFTAGKIDVKQESKRLINTNTYKTAFGKFDIMTYCAEAILNYTVPHNTYSIIPNLGLRYSKSHDSGYNEYGTGIHNFHVSGQTYTSLSAQLGIKLKRSYNISNNILFTPGIHGQVERYLYNKSDGVQIHKQWVDSLSTDTRAPATNIHKTGYNLGATAALAYQNIDFLLTYNTHIRKKYKSHQGTFRIKYSF